MKKKEIPKGKSDLLTVKEAADWASLHLSREISSSNISYLIQYGRVPKHSDNGAILIDKKELIEYYEVREKREDAWKKKLGEDVNWGLSFDNLREKDTTKHVHRLHPYKGKFIPQLVNYFLDGHINHFKKEVYFKPGDIILDPFCGSGTTLVQCAELGMHAIGIDISPFNCLISNVKVGSHKVEELSDECNTITIKLKQFLVESNTASFEQELEESLSTFNKQYFASPDFKTKIHQKAIDEVAYATKMERTFLPVYRKLVKKHHVHTEVNEDGTFLDKWYLDQVRQEIDLARRRIERLPDSETKNTLRVILSRTVRSCRATTHSDLATLKHPVTTPYYCPKHYKICKPLFSILRWWGHYSGDTIARLQEFDGLRSETLQICMEGDSRTVDILKALEVTREDLYDVVKTNAIDGIFTSPPYVGLINYHEQHAYAYDLYDIERKDEMEIGAMSRGQSKKAKEEYVKGISEVFTNCRSSLKDDCHVFVVANDKYELYPRIAELSGLRIAKVFKRPVLNRTERDKGAYAESIFHMRKA